MAGTVILSTTSTNGDISRRHTSAALLSETGADRRSEVLLLPESLAFLQWPRGEKWVYWEPPTRQSQTCLRQWHVTPAPHEQTVLICSGFCFRNHMFLGVPWNFTESTTTSFFSSLLFHPQLPPILYYFECANSLVRGNFQNLTKVEMLNLRNLTH